MPRKKFWQKFGYPSHESMIESKAGAWDGPRWETDKGDDTFQDVVAEPPPFEADDEDDTNPEQEDA